MESEMTAKIAHTKIPDRLLIWTLIALVLFCLIGLFYYVKVLNKPLPGISVVYAQSVDQSLSKKKVF